MDSLLTFFAESKSRDIHTLASYIERYLAEAWEPVFIHNRDEMVRLYPEIGDSVYGIYGKHLFRALHEQFKEAGLRSTPRLPFGGFSDSREWGPEEDRQRWFWSKITTTDGSVLGTIALAFYHDHIEIRIPRPPRVMALEESSKGAVLAALGRLSPDFKAATEARIEIAEYLAQLAQGSAAEE